MTVSYSPSWEEFAELYQDSLPSPDIISFIAMICVSVLVGAFGAFAMSIAKTTANQLGASLFCAIAVVVAVAAYWDLKIRPKGHRDAYLREVRSIYERFYSASRTFTFDAEKWTVQSDSGRRESTWSGLQRASESKNVFMLTGESESALIPKRVLDEAALQSLRQLAFKSSGQAMPGRVAFADYLSNTIQLTLRGQLFLAWMFVLLVIAIGAGGFISNFGGDDVFFGAIFGGGILLLSAIALFAALVVQYRTTHRRAKAPLDTEFLSQGVRYRTADAESFVCWRTFRKFQETGRCFLLFPDSGHYYTYAKRGLSPVEVASVREILQNNLPSC
jgi:hypothetical protein